LPEREIRALAYAAVLHDTGELFINRQILMRPTNLPATEVNKVREHPRKSVEWMKRAGLGDELSQHIVLRHHERFDGSGYPYNLRGKMLESVDNILALADMFAALVSLRPHRAAMPRRNALKMILEHRGKWFADEITDRFASALGFYPPGSIVQLRSGSCAVILEPPSESTWIAMRIDPQSTGLKSEEINLHSLKDDYIVNEIATD
jgi:HD-GYP domain-containing protein (c-di-GMP phosphodiesterase class II)